MFEENYADVGLTDIEIYYLAQELKFSQIIGLSIDYDSLNKELKNENHQICYDFFKENNILDMDFSGNVTVDEKYQKIITAFEKPDYCCIVHHRDFKNDIGAMRKIYKNNSEWIALDYYEQETSDVFIFDNSYDADKFMFSSCKISASPDAKADSEVYSVMNYGKFSKNAEQTVVITEYISVNGQMTIEQHLYIEFDGVWYVLDFNEDSFTKQPVNKTITIRK